MPFPDSPRVIYARNPLVEVVCQLRFPPILRIDSEPPSDFQEKIRHDYPLFKENQITDLKLDLPHEIVKLSGGAFPSSLRAGRAAYDFISADEYWKIGLTREFIALTTTKYEHWQDFKNHLKTPLEVFTAIYSPPFYSRIGLRYRDVIRRSALGLKNTEWSELLQPHIAGELCSSDVMENIKGIAKQTQIYLANKSGMVLIQHGLVESPEGEVCYLIDSDFSFSDRTEINHVSEKLDSFNQKSRRLFRWCISEKLHEAMEPRAI